MHRSSKPVRKCNGCGLNFRDNCGVFEDPHDQWSSHHRCPGHMNEEMLAEYNERQALALKNDKKVKRKEDAKKRKTEAHHDGDRHVVMTAR